MLSAYLDGELDRRGARRGRGASRGVGRVARGAGRGARRARRRARRCPTRRADGFWDAVHASVAADDDPTTPTARSSCRSPRRAPTRRRWSLGRGVGRGRRRGGRGDRGPAPQRGVAERDCGGRAARRAGVRLRRSDQHARPRRSAGRVPPMTALRRPATSRLCALAVLALAWPIAASAGAGDRPTRRRRPASCAAHATPRPSTTSPVTPPSPGPRDGQRDDAGARDRRRRCGRHHDRRRNTVIDEGRRTYLRDRLGWTGLVVEPTARDLPEPDRRGGSRPQGPARWRTARRRSCWPPAPTGSPPSAWSSTTPPGCCSAARCSARRAGASARCGSRASRSGERDARTTSPPADVTQPHRREAHVAARRVPRAGRARGVRVRDALTPSRRRAALLQRRAVHRVGVRAAG